MKKFYRFFTAFALVGMISIFAVNAQNRPVYELHSMMIYNFLKYIQWPDDQSGNDFVITVYGDDEVYNTLNTWYGNKQKLNRKIVVKKAGSVAEIGNPHLIYVGTKASNQFEEVMTKIDPAATLVITDKRGLAEKGSCINFRIINDRLKFELNQEAVSKSNLKISSQLTSMAILI
ncbi:MAG: YfiR family protein [Candidatus Cyclobacteriaceae bacterium M2_1C_046]